ncbi:hypothetical protein [Pseudonocardia kunmingensis]|uniref:Uncharacterized protein n=1 Tax=Pseudonocardia kunmingensis TaxID=630975 RepID=A0A543CX58_9PSEU|nr:hypothetical protein [Pseudonocardia kunmingensis]TQM01680.1 hypothetical protein FB558_8581 [Pseudonocardia kunmingensis]
MTTRNLAAIAAGLYGLWGLLHLGLGAALSWNALATGLPASEPGAESVMFFVCAMVFGGQAVAVAVTMNRHNDRLGYWLNLIVLGVVDIAFLVVMVLPGHVDLVGGLSGPLIWCLAAAVSTVALRRSARSPAARRSSA